MALLKTPAAYLFDMDGLLLDTERMFLEAFLTLTDDLGIATEEAKAFFGGLVGTSSKVTTKRLHEFLPHQTDVAEFDQRWRLLHQDNVVHGVPTKPYAIEVLQAIQDAKVPMAVVTSTHGPSAQHHLQKAGILPFFETVCTGDEVVANKPDPEPYLEGSRRLGVDPAHCVAFEDSDFGTTAAVRAGCLTVQIPDLRPPNTPLPDLGQIVARDLRHGAVQIGLFEDALT
ncbi:HAD family phosphatase [uncultured Shimia sp.]|uniref:HAD family hydrolase n=1 Tax=uncultured Shimia sp. TaxID=573152 RepID=UPI0025FB10D5|nr:HAD family phosphatase [uncultured Shimia sp.]